MDQTIFRDFRLSQQEKDLGVYGVHVYQSGKGSAEHHFRSDDYVCLYSASKTFTSIGVGICIDEGGIKLTDSALSFFPEWEAIAAPGSEKITLRDLLHMASGKEAFWASEEQQRAGMDIGEAFFREPMHTQPGSKFFYSNYCTYMLGRIIEKVTGQISRDYLVDKLFTPLDIFNPQWHTCPQGHTIAASALFLRTRDLAKLGKLMLHKGEWEGRRIVSEGYIDALHNDTISTENWSFDEDSNQGYGYQVWRCCENGLYRADGMYGQFSIVIPQKDAVVTTTSHNEKRPNDIIRAVVSDIMPLL